MSYKLDRDLKFNILNLPNFYGVLRVEKIAECVFSPCPCYSTESSKNQKNQIKWEFKWHLHRAAIRPLKSGSNWNLEMLVFEERGKPDYLEKNLSSREENQQQTQPTYGVESWNRSRATLVGGECPHHHTIPAPSKLSKLTINEVRILNKCLNIPH